MSQRTAVPDSYTLRFGPYRAPKVFRGDKLFCEIRGTVTVGGYSDATIPWPRVKKGGLLCLILCGELVRAVKHEAMIAVARHWGVSETTVWKWRTALGVERWNVGSTQLASDWAHSRHDDRLERVGASSRKAQSLSKLSESKSGRVNGVMLDGQAVQSLRESQGTRRLELARRAGLGNTQLAPHQSRTPSHCNSIRWNGRLSSKSGRIMTFCAESPALGC